jgi:hypothetical protein
MAIPSSICFDFQHGVMPEQLCICSHGTNECKSTELRVGHVPHGFLGLLWGEYLVLGRLRCRMSSRFDKQGLSQRSGLTCCYLSTFLGKSQHKKPGHRYPSLPWPWHCRCAGFKQKTLFKLTVHPRLRARESRNAHKCSNHTEARIFGRSISNVQDDIFILFGYFRYQGH